MKIKVVFHGKLLELADAGQKYYYDVTSLSDLKLRIRDDFPQIVHINHMIFLNNKRRSGNARLKDNDKINLIPGEDL